MADITLSDANAVKLSIAECCKPKAPDGITNVNPHLMYGYFQISTQPQMNNWVAWGGKMSEVRHASWDRQLEVARVGWNSMIKALESRGYPPSEASDVYCAWNIGAATVDVLKKDPNGIMAAHPRQLALCRVQAWAATGQMTCSYALSLCKNWFDKGKKPLWIPPIANATTGKPDPDEISPAADAQGGEAIRGNIGQWGGITRLYMVKNTLNPDEIKWTTQQTPGAISQLFYMPPELCMNGTDSFLDRRANVGMISVSQECPMIPTVSAGGSVYAFIPLTMS